MFNRKKKKNKGFTLVELLVVIAIIGILAVVAVPSLFNQINKSKAAKIEGDYSTIKSAVMSEYADGKTVTEIKNAGTAGLNIEGLKDTSKFEIKEGDEGSNTVLKLEITADNDTVAKKVQEDLGSDIASVSGNTVTIKLITNKTTK